MTTREVLHDLVDRLTDADLDRLARLAREGGLQPSPDSSAERARWIDGREHPALVAVWDNDDDAIFDDM